MTVVTANIHSARAVPSSHSVWIDRRTGDDFVRPTGVPTVLPGEAIRFSATDLGTSVIFKVFDSGENLIGEKQVSPNLRHNAWWDTVAPPEEGRYLLVGSSREVYLGGFPSPFRHDARLEFVVDKNAPRPPEQPSGGFNFGDIKTLMYVGAGVLGLVAVASVVGAVRK